MSLEKLKSAYGNLVLASPTVEKTGKDVNPSIQPSDKEGKGVNSVSGTPLDKMVSRFSIQNQPQIIDNMINEKSSGNSKGYQSTSFTGVEGKLPNLTFSGDTLAYTNRNIEWPGPVNFISDQKASGFTLDRVHKSPSLYGGVVDGQKPVAKWVNDLLAGGSLFALNEPKQEFFQTSSKNFSKTPTLYAKKFTMRPNKFPTYPSHFVHI